MRPNSPEIPEPSGLEAPDYKEQMQSMKDKSKALDELPDIQQVKNHSCEMWNRVWVYTGSWYKGWAKKFDNPWGGKWTFRTNDEKVTLSWEWGKNWELLSKSWTIYTDWKTYNIQAAYYKTWHPEQFSSLEATWRDAEGCNYKVTIDKNLRVTTLTYKWVTVNITHSGWKMYVESKRGGKLELGGNNVDWDVGAGYVCSRISDVKNHPNALDHFEVDSWTHNLEADMYDQSTELDLSGGSNTWKNAWILNTTASKWLNDSRKDFGI